MYQYIKLLSDLSYEIGLIGWSEYTERSQIADWLADTKDSLLDPRMSSSEEFSDNVENYNNEQIETSSFTQAKDEDQPLEILLLKKWMFTIGDTDCYPSVPHGHLHKKTNEWPKLNPYTGRAFLRMHNENARLRLSKDDMRLIWNNLNFVEHCREQVLWYSSFAPKYNFPRARFGKFVFPVWK